MVVVSLYLLRDSREAAGQRRSEEARTSRNQRAQRAAAPRHLALLLAACLAASPRGATAQSSASHAFTVVSPALLSPDFGVGDAPWTASFAASPPAFNVVIGATPVAGALTLSLTAQFVSPKPLWSVVFDISGFSLSIYPARINASSTADPLCNIGVLSNANGGSSSCNVAFYLDASCGGTSASYAAWTPGANASLHFTLSAGGQPGLPTDGCGLPFAAVPFSAPRGPTPTNGCSPLSIAPNTRLSFGGGSSVAQPFASIGGSVFAVRFDTNVALPAVNCSALAVSGAAAAAANIFPDLFPSLVSLPFAPAAQLVVAFNGVTVKDSDLILPSGAATAPVLTIIGNDPPGTFYTLAEVDPDAPSPAMPTIRSYCHYIVANLQQGIALNNSGTIVIPYQAPAPPMGIHRYIFLLFKQPRGLTFNASQLAAITPAARPSFNVSQWAANNTFGAPVGVTFFRSPAPSAG